METEVSDTSVPLAWTKYKDLLAQFQNLTDKIFYRVGLSIGKKPWQWILFSIGVSLVCGPGLSLWKEELDDVELFLPKDSQVRYDAAWVKEHFQHDLRYESIIVTAPNVLEPQVLQTISEIEDEVKNIIVKNRTWQDVCVGYRTWFDDGSAVSPDDKEFTEEILRVLNTTMIKDECIYQSLLTLWQNNARNYVSRTTKQEILEDITLAIKDKTNRNMLLDVESLLSGIEYDSYNGGVKSAKATILHWMLKETNEYSPDWELEFINRVLYSNRSYPEGMEVFAIAKRSYKDFLGQVLDSNMTILCCGLSLIAVYVTTMIGRCNILHQRIYLSLMGISVVGQAIICSYGICYYMGFFYGPIHPILPFLLLGIGVDDMFVIMQSLRSLSATDKNLQVPVRIAKAIQHSGASITVTSLTNVVAFGIGITTVMPFLRSFCVFAATAILFLYIFEITFFVSCLAYDERRVDSKREGCCFTRKNDWKQNECSQRSYQQIIFEEYLSAFIIKTPLEQKFDPLWYLNQETYPIKFNTKLTEYFPKYGKRAGIYLTGVDYYEDRKSLKQFVHKLQNNPFINNRTLEPWFIGYENWLNITNKGNNIENKDEYYSVLTEYLLLTKEGQTRIQDIKFDKRPIGEYNVTTSQIPIQHILINTTTDQIRAMQSIRDTIKTVNFTRGHDHIALFSPDYVSWAANRVIGEELIRNLCLEVFAVGLVTILLLRDIRTSFWVIACVLLTLVNLLGSMHFLGLTIEISSSIIVLLCAGLSVDYAAHIGLEFTRAQGTKNERAMKTLIVIGPAVFNGGFSTFLAFILLGFSKAYLFSTFFKLFTCVVVFGLFHGLFFLPVILTFCGPNKRSMDNSVKNHIVLDQNRYYTIRLSDNGKDIGLNGAAK
ncbi:patched domain-containing protein 3-like isoform X2 [Prorops nasuta]|uniref:patched domain-containing protein 3-like isoform X2 n=1 Tax=Prorops nasuta TaxID=863751 RepID=UPI0034D01080